VPVLPDGVHGGQCCSEQARNLEWCPRCCWPQECRQITDFGHLLSLLRLAILRSVILDVAAVK
jgi:hypothetical protein